MIVRIPLPLMLPPVIEILIINPSSHSTRPDRQLSQLTIQPVPQPVRRQPRIRITGLRHEREIEQQKAHAKAPEEQRPSIAGCAHAVGLVEQSTPEFLLVVELLNLRHLAKYWRPSFPGAVRVREDVECWFCGETWVGWLREAKEAVFDE